MSGCRWLSSVICGESVAKFRRNGHRCRSATCGRRAVNPTDDSYAGSNPAPATSMHHRVDVAVGSPSGSPLEPAGLYVRAALAWARDVRRPVSCSFDLGTRWGALVDAPSCPAVSVRNRRLRGLRGGVAVAASDCSGLPHRIAQARAGRCSSSRRKGKSKTTSRANATAVAVNRYHGQGARTDSREGFSGARRGTCSSIR